MLKTNICGVNFKNPLMLAAGVLGSNASSLNWVLKSGAAGVVTKSFSKEPNTGYKNPTTVGVDCGIINAIGLSNPGVDNFIEEIRRVETGEDKVLIASIYGATPDEFSFLVEKIQDDVDMIELNISCPNVRCGGAAFGQDEKTVEKITREVKAECGEKPLIVKLSPNVTDIRVMALAAEKNGADALSLINTVMGMKIDLKTKKPFFENKVAGLSGAAVHPIAVRMVYQVRTVTSLPIIGMGGIMCAEDAIELMMAGANAVAVGTATLINPYSARDIKNELVRYMSDNGISDIAEIICAAHK